MSLLNISAILRLNSDEYDKGLNDAEGKANGFGQALGTAAKVGAAGFAAAGAAVAAVTSQAVSGYAQYQQLAGGVQKLFGDAQNIVMKNAEQAFKTTGMSANQYMEQVTSFSAALVNSLGGNTEEAAKRADVAMRAISDNVNTFGSDMGSVQNAFQGFAKQNYTMLDNLKLGYGGTKSEMERLIADANEYAVSIGQAGDLSIESFADIVTAIDLVQQKQNIAGTTAKEAASTISGSLGMLKGAWDNLLAGLGDADADINNLVSNVIDSAKTVLDNVIPVIGTVLTSLGRVLNEMAPAIIAEIPGIVATIIPVAIDAVGTLFSAIVSAIPVLAQSLLSVGYEIIAPMAAGMLQNAPTMIAAMGNNLSQIVASIMQKLPEFLSKGVEIVGQMAQGLIQNAPAIINAIIQALAQLIATIASNLPQFLAKGIELIAQIAAGIIQAIPQAVAAIPQVISGIVNAFTSFNWLSIGTNIISGIASGIRNAAGSVIDAIGGVASSAINGAKRLLGIASPSKLFRDQVGKMIPAGMAIGIAENTPMVTEAVDDMSEDAFDTMPDVGYDKDVIVDKIGTEPDSWNGAVVAALQALTYAIYTLDDKLQGKMEEALETMRFDLNGREFGRLVRDVRV